MELRRTAGPTGDPFFDTVRERHPDVDIVVLPPVVPPTPGDPLDLAQARELRDAQLASAERLWREAAEGAGSLTHRVGAGGPGALRWESTGALRGTRDGFRVLARLAAALETWDLRRQDAPVALLAAGSPDGRSVTATYAEETGVLVFRATSPDVPVSDETRSVLRGEG